MQKCRICEKPLITASAECNVFCPDPEPYAAGEREETEFDSINEYIAIGILWCPEHGVQRIWLQEPQLQLTPAAPDCAIELEFCEDCDRYEDGNPNHDCPDCPHSG